MYIIGWHKDDNLQRENGYESKERSLWRVIYFFSIYFYYDMCIRAIVYVIYREPKDECVWDKIFDEYEGCDWNRITNEEIYIRMG